MPHVPNFQFYVTHYYFHPLFLFFFDNYTQFMSICQYSIFECGKVLMKNKEGLP